VAKDGRVRRLRTGDQFKVGSEEKLRSALNGLLVA